MDLWTSQGLDPQIREFSSQFLKCHPYNLLGHPIWTHRANEADSQVDVWFKAVKAGKGSAMYDTRIYNVMHALEAMPKRGRQTLFWEFAWILWWPTKHKPA